MYQLFQYNARTSILMHSNSLLVGCSKNRAKVVYKSCTSPLHPRIVLQELQLLSKGERPRAYIQSRSALQRHPAIASMRMLFVSCSCCFWFQYLHRNIRVTSLIWSGFGVFKTHTRSPPTIHPVLSIAWRGAHAGPDVAASTQPLTG